VKITIEMSPKNYGGLLSKIAVGSLAYSLLKNGIVNYHPEPGNERRVIDILCERVEAKALLRVANEIWPEAAFEINDSIARANVLR
jgi:hypothetical protein